MNVYTSDSFVTRKRRSRGRRQEDLFYSAGLTYDTD